MNEITIRDIQDMPMFKPEAMSDKEIFNATGDSTPINELVGKEFQITGILPEVVDVPKYNDNDKSKMSREAWEALDHTLTVKRLRLTLFTTEGTYHSFSVTFAKALSKAINLFGPEKYRDEKFSLASKNRGGKAYYVLTAL